MKCAIDTEKKRTEEENRKQRIQIKVLNNKSKKIFRINQKKTEKINGKKTEKRSKY